MTYRQIHNLAYNALKLLMEINAEVFEQCSAAYKASRMGSVSLRKDRVVYRHELTPDVAHTVKRRSRRLERQSGRACATMPFATRIRAHPSPPRCSAVTSYPKGRTTRCGKRKTSRMRRSATWRTTSRLCRALPPQSTCSAAGRLRINAWRVMTGMATWCVSLYDGHAAAGSHS